MKPTMVTAFTDFLEGVKKKGIGWRHLLNNNTTKRPGGDSVDACIGDTIHFWK